MKIALILGTRPEIIKMCPIIRELENRKADYFILHTGQHYSKNLDEIFFKELNLPQPKYYLGIGSGTHAEQSGKMMIEIEKILIAEKPGCILVQGDTNSVLAGALAASKLDIKIGHVEAGLRSYDRKMPEEVNRVLTDHISDFLFAPTEEAKSNLLKEGISAEKIFVFGNTIVDAVYQNLAIANEKSKFMEKSNLKKDDFFVVTIHRPSNVDNKESFSRILDALGEAHKKYGKKIIFPIHPRSKKMMDLFGLSPSQGISLVEPLGYLDFSHLTANSSLMLTDSGGIQEEACILKVPHVTLRENTERPETITVGANVLVGNDKSAIISGINKMLSKERTWNNPFGDGKTSEKIVDLLLS